MLIIIIIQGFKTLFNVFEKTPENRQEGLFKFHPYANFNCPYLKIGLCDLFPVLLTCITFRRVYHIVAYLQVGVYHIVPMIAISSENGLPEYVGYANCIEYKIKICHKYFTIPV